VFIWWLRERRRAKQGRSIYWSAGDGDMNEKAVERREMHGAVPAAGGAGAAAGVGPVMAGAAGGSWYHDRSSESSETSLPAGAVAGLRSQSSGFKSSQRSSDPAHPSYPSSAGRSSRALLEPFDFEAPQPLVPAVQARGSDWPEDWPTGYSDDNQSSVYSIAREDPADAAAARPFSGTGMSSWYNERDSTLFAPGTDLSTLEGPPQQPESSYGGPQQDAVPYGRHWPLSSR
jgi:hypothetical protein